MGVGECHLQSHLGKLELFKHTRNWHLKGPVSVKCNAAEATPSHGSSPCSWSTATIVWVAAQTGGTRAVDLNTQRAKCGLCPTRCPYDQPDGNCFILNQFMMKIMM